MLSRILYWRTLYFASASSRQLLCPQRASPRNLSRPSNSFSSRSRTQHSSRLKSHPNRRKRGSSAHFTDSARLNTLLTGKWTEVTAKPSSRKYSNRCKHNNQSYGRIGGAKRATTVPMVTEFSAPISRARVALMQVARIARSWIISVVNSVRQYYPSSCPVRTSFMSTVSYVNAGS